MQVSSLFSSCNCKLPANVAALTFWWDLLAKELLVLFLLFKGKCSLGWTSGCAKKTKYYLLAFTAKDKKKPALKVFQALLRLIPNLKAKIPACITTTKQRPARSIVVEVSMKNIRTFTILSLNCQKWGNLQNPVMD